ncbi:protein kinase domain-containing protein [Amnibacterium kyonggiense]|uniref:GAF domain-containing protein n=1 Tax=Amnibacterium kyonggiense TaxID=595671 RepID=A0A4R7FPL0_9MICO|nr:protein kinase [Amnibacterium kyonggiense]TDS79697.1 GAF domain-containing protein [Amnibacterium kyonggiense]
MSDPSSPRLIAGRYVLGEPIGRGGRAVVYEARDPLLDRDVAVKLFHADAVDARSVRVQEAEARLVAGMNHPGLTTLFDAGVDTSDPDRSRVYLVMERIPGVDLRRRIREHGPLTPAQVAYLGFDLAEALQYVHEHGFLHRDIKPANVLLADRRIDSRIRGKLSDFGIASLIGSQRNGEETSGTVAYLSPEQVDEQEPTPASDVYALGLVLLEALTGEVAFPGSPEESAAERLDRDPRIPETVPAPLADVLRGMTALVPEDRPDLEAVALAFQTAYVRDLVGAGRVDPSRLATDEERRLAAVRRYNILDTPPDDAFDRIAELARRLLDVPIALISIVDADREWFKSSRGIDERQIDRDVALCANTVATGRPLCVPDVQDGDAFAANPIVSGHPELHGFAAVPITTSDGHVIGTLCVFDRRVRAFSEEELRDLGALAAIAVRELDLRLATRRALFDG